MSTPFLGEIRMFAGNFAPRSWALCNGQLLPIQQNAALFALLGTSFGGNGQTTFALPNLQGSFPLGMGQGPGLTDRDIGEIGGEVLVILAPNQGASHSHPAMASTGPATSFTPVAAVLASNPSNPIYGTVGQGAAIAMGPLATTGSPQATQPHNNVQPYLAVTFIIALAGIFPSRN
jgi:microcystin-dependent protein